jgi:hypothetical protein
MLQNPKSPYGKTIVFTNCNHLHHSRTTVLLPSAANCTHPPVSKITLPIFLSLKINPVYHLLILIFNLIDLLYDLLSFNFQRS